MFRYLLILSFLFSAVSSSPVLGREVDHKEVPEWEVRARQGVHIEIGGQDRRGHRRRHHGRRGRYHPQYDRHHPSYRYYRYHPYYYPSRPHYYDYYSGYTYVGSSEIVNVEGSRIRLNNGMVFQFRGSAPSVSIGTQVYVFRVIRSATGFSFGVGSGPFRFYYRDAKGRNYRYYIEIGSHRYLVDRLE